MNPVTRALQTIAAIQSENSRTDAGGGSFKVLDQTASLAKLERKLTSFFQWSRQTEGAVHDWQGNCELEQRFRRVADRSG